jgi:hypothetical protein
MRFLAYSKLDSQRNVDVREKLKVQSIVDENQTFQTNWKEQVERMQDERLPKLTSKYKPEGKRNRGRPKKRWKEQFLEDG